MRQVTEIEFLDAQSELNKRGIRLNAKGPHAYRSAAASDKPWLLEDRANVRRAMNEIRNEARELLNADDPTMESVERATELSKLLDTCGDIIDQIGIALDVSERCAEMDAAGSFAPLFGATQSNESVLRDRSGQRIGNLLSAADLRDSNKIAAKVRKEPRAFDHDIGEEGNLTAFFRGVAGGRTTDAIRASLSEGTDSEGGYVVPTWLLPGILAALVPASTMLQAGANVAILQTLADSFRIAAVDTVPTAAWRSESAALAEPDPTFRAISIVPRSLAFIFKVSRELLMDGHGIEGALRTAIAQAFAVAIDKAGLMGSGTAPEIAGILNTTGINSYDMGTNGAELKNYSSIIKAARTIADDDAPMPTAIITSNREAETIDLFADTTGQPLRRPPALEQMKFLATSQIPIDDDHGTASNASSMFMGDFTLATLYMREALSIQKLNERYADTGEIGFACHSRVDLGLAYPSAFCVIKGVIPAAAT